ncbi:hypothetical protein LJR129_004959 [Acidovorax sp. LjRoot129]|uniref:hypothetical protein n=1 Tax=unclassified Acidovorax TaxID=2684926 RepID=UPI003ECF7E4F
MNDQRRREIQTLLDELMDLRDRLQQIHDDEVEAFENMPESLQSAQNGQASEEAASALDAALDCFEEIATSLLEAKGEN